jgi:hypothetical protein
MVCALELDVVASNDRVTASHHLDGRGSIGGRGRKRSRPDVSTTIIRRR